MNSNDDKSERIIQLLEEILKWIRIQGIQNVKGILNDILRKDIEKLIYNNSDGRTSREIAKTVGVSHATVVNYWNRWAKYGLVEEIRAQGGTRYKRVFSLLDLGIELPTINSTIGKDEQRNESMEESK